MKTSNNNFDYSNLTDEQLKGVALLQHLGDAFFILDDKIFLGSDNLALEAYNEANGMELTLEDVEDKDYRDGFYDYCVQELKQADEIDSNCYSANNNYMVCTDSEADEKWEESLDSYLEECIYPELSGNLAQYFDDEKWKIDERFDGRGHSLSSYDGNENEETVDGVMYFIYRVN